MQPEPSESMRGTSSWLPALRATAIAFAVGRATEAYGADAHEVGAATADSADVKAWELAGRISYLTPPIAGGANPFGVGIGGRIGVSIADVYFGATVVDQVGTQSLDLHAHSVLYGGELGYGLRVATGRRTFFTFRPELGIGGATLFYTTLAATTATATNFYLQPGLNVMFTFQSIFVAVRGSMLAVPGVDDGNGGSSTWRSYGADAQLGIRF